MTTTPKTDYQRMLRLLIEKALQPVEPDPEFKYLLMTANTLEGVLSQIGYDILKVKAVAREASSDKENLRASIDQQGINTLIEGLLGSLVCLCTAYLSNKNRTPESATVDTTEQRLLTSIVETIKVKNANYGESWSKRGGQGAFFSFVRKTDRLATLVPKYLAGEVLNTAGDDDFDDTFVDIIGYAGLFLERRAALIDVMLEQANNGTST